MLHKTIAKSYSPGTGGAEVIDELIDRCLTQLSADAGYEVVLVDVKTTTVGNNFVAVTVLAEEEQQVQRQGGRMLSPRSF